MYQKLLQSFATFGHIKATQPDKILSFAIVQVPCQISHCPPHRNTTWRTKWAMPRHLCSADADTGSLRCPCPYALSTTSESLTLPQSPPLWQHVSASDTVIESVFAHAGRPQNVQESSTRKRRPVPERKPNVRFRFHRKSVIYSRIIAGTKERPVFQIGTACFAEYCSLVVTFLPEICKLTFTTDNSKTRAPKQAHTENPHQCWTAHVCAEKRNATVSEFTPTSACSSKSVTSARLCKRASLSTSMQDRFFPFPDTIRLGRKDGWRRSALPSMDLTDRAVNPPNARKQKLPSVHMQAGQRWSGFLHKSRVSSFIAPSFQRWIFTLPARFVITYVAEFTLCGVSCATPQGPRPSACPQRLSCVQRSRTPTQDRSTRDCTRKHTTIVHASQRSHIPGDRERSGRNSTREQKRPLHSTTFAAVIFFF